MTVSPRSDAYNEKCHTVDRLLWETNHTEGRRGAPNRASLRLRRGAGAGGAGGAGWRTLAEKGYYIPRLPARAKSGTGGFE